MTTRDSEPPRSAGPPPEPGPVARLVDAPTTAPTVHPDADAWALDLLRSAEPYRPAVARKQRVQLRLGYTPRRKAPLALRAAIVLVVLISCGAFARAALGHWPAWMVRAYERVVSPVAAPALSPPPPIGPRARGARSADGPKSAPPEAPAAAVVEAPASAPAMSAPAPNTAPRARRSAALASEDSAPVLEAMRALRRDRDPMRARVLLTRYLDRNPGGTLAEEALALSIEAAVAQQDSDAAVLAARYLRLYPTGPFRPLARQTLSATAQQP